MNAATRFRAACASLGPRAGYGGVRRPTHPPGPVRRWRAGAVLAVAAGLAALGTAPAGAQTASRLTVGSAQKLMPSGRLLRPAGRLTTVGNLPLGAAATPDGRFYWTVSGGRGANDVRIVDVARGEVIQTLPLPGASGGVAMDPSRRRAYVSGVAASGSAKASVGTAGREADLIWAYDYGPSGRARLVRRISVRPPSFALPVQNFPKVKAPTRVGWPQMPAVSRDGATLLVPLNLAGVAAIVDVRSGRVRHVSTGDYPYGAAILPGSRIGLVSNEAPGTVSVIDLRRGRKLRDLAVGPPLSHPTAIALDPAGRRAYVTLTNTDEVVVLDARRLRVLRRLSVRRPEGLGAYPVAASVAPDGHRLVVAEAGADAVSVFRLPGGAGPAFTLAGRIPTAAFPMDVSAAPASGRACTPAAPARRQRGSAPVRCARILWLSAKGFGTGANPFGPNPYRDDPGNLDEYAAKLVKGRVGALILPSGAALASLTQAAAAELIPTNAVAAAPPDTPLRADGPIQHVIFVVKQNRTYDQVLGDDPRGDGEPGLALLGKEITPNIHALVQRFPLLDRTFADSDASPDGHQWTTGATITPYVQRVWAQTYARRGRPVDFYSYSISWPGSGFIFDALERNGISWANLGEARTGVIAHPDRDRTPALTALVKAKAAHSDLGPPDGCFPNNIAQLLGEAEVRPIFDSTPPVGASLRAISRMACFRTTLDRWIATGTTPRFTYMILPSDHTRGPIPGQRTPRAMVAENDWAVGQLVDTVSHSPIWPHTAIFIIEDDAQNGADHVNAHRMPALVISPYARRGAVVSTRYDTASVLRSMELILGLAPLGLNDALAVPMHDAFQATPDNAEPYTAVAPDYDLLETN